MTVTISTLEAATLREFVRMFKSPQAQIQVLQKAIVGKLTKIVSDPINISELNDEVNVSFEFDKLEINYIQHIASHFFNLFNPLYEEKKMLPDVLPVFNALKRIRNVIR